MYGPASAPGMRTRHVSIFKYLFRKKGIPNNPADIWQPGEERRECGGTPTHAHASAGKPPARQAAREHTQFCAILVCGLCAASQVSEFNLNAPKPCVSGRRRRRRWRRRCGPRKQHHCLGDPTAHPGSVAEPEIGRCRRECSGGDRNGEAN